MSQSKQHPNRISGWLPDEHKWLHECLEDLSQTMTEGGTRTTKNDLVLAALLRQYGHLKANYEHSSQAVRSG